MKIFLVNKKAYRDYEITEKTEAGIELTGYEVKSLREGKGSLKGSYVRKIKNSMEIIGMDLPKYSKAGELFDYDSKRNRRLLLHKQEIRSLGQKIDAKGYTAVPLKIYLLNNRFKLLVGLGRGKTKANVKQDLINKQQKLELNRFLKSQNQ